MKTSMVFFLLLVCYCLFSCKNDENKCLENVKSYFPNSKIYKDPNKKFTFYVIDSTGLREVIMFIRTDKFRKNIGVTEFVPVK